MKEIFDTLLIYGRALMDGAWFKAVLAAVIGTLSGLLGDSGPLFQLLLNAPALAVGYFDYILGSVHAGMQGRLRGWMSIRGMIKNVAYVISVLVVGVMDNAAAHVVDMVHIPFLDIFMGYLVAHESISCLGHLAAFGVPVPPRLLETLKAYHARLGGDNDNGNGNV